MPMQGRKCSYMMCKNCCKEKTFRETLDCKGKGFCIFIAITDLHYINLYAGSHINLGLLFLLPDNYTYRYQNYYTYRYQNINYKYRYQSNYTYRYQNNYIKM